MASESFLRRIIYSSYSHSAMLVLPNNFFALQQLWLFVDPRIGAVTDGVYP